MLNLDNIEELDLVGVADRGVPNKERIIMRPRWEIENLQGYIVGLGIVDSTNPLSLTPLANFAFFFTECCPELNSWIVLYTGKGEPQVTELPTTGQRAYTFFWGYDRVLFKHPLIIPVVLRVAGMEHPGGRPLDLPGYNPTVPNSGLLEG